MVKPLAAQEGAWRRGLGWGGKQGVGGSVVLGHLASAGRAKCASCVAWRWWPSPAVRPLEGLVAARGGSPSVHEVLRRAWRGPAKGERCRCLCGDVAKHGRL